MQDYMLQEFTTLENRMKELREHVLPRAGYGWFAECIKQLIADLEDHVNGTVRQD